MGDGIPPCTHSHLVLRHDYAKLYRGRNGDQLVAFRFRCFNFVYSLHGEYQVHPFRCRLLRLVHYALGLVPQLLGPRHYSCHIQVRILWARAPTLPTRTRHPYLILDLALLLASLLDVFVPVDACLGIRHKKHRRCAYILLKGYKSCKGSSSRKG